MSQLGHDLILWLANIMDLLGALVLVTTAILVFLNFWRRLSGETERLRLSLAQGLALGLEFKLGGEILRTVAIRSPQWSHGPGGNRLASGSNEPSNPLGNKAL